LALGKRKVEIKKKNKNKNYPRKFELHLNRKKRGVKTIKKKEIRGGGEGLGSWKRMGKFRGDVRGSGENTGSEMGRARI